jgi:hypothetical protein
MIRQSYSGYPGWVDSPHAMSVHDRLQQSRQRTQDLRNHNQRVSRDWGPAHKQPALAYPTTSSGTGGTGSARERKRSGGFLGVLVKFVFWTYVISAILHGVPPG